MRGVFVNPELCIGCLQCELACAVEHSESRDEALAFLEVPVPRKRVHVAPGPVPTTAFPNRCRHCDPAPCQRVCPAGAITRDEEHDVVVIDAARCIGCAMCAVVCPFDVITFHSLAEGPSPDTAVAVKCDGCLARLRRGEEPACAESCKVGALVFGDINDLVAQGRLQRSAAVLARAELDGEPVGSDHRLDPWHSWGEAQLIAAGVSSTAATDGHGSVPSTNTKEE